MELIWHFILVAVGGVVLALASVVPIGPVNTEIARRTLRDGLPVGLAVGAGLVAAETLLALLAALGATRLLENDTVQRVAAFGGIALITVMAVVSWRGAVVQWRKLKADAHDGDVEAAGHAGPKVSAMVRGAAGALGMTLLNPLTWMWWVLALPAFLAKLGRSHELDLPIIVVSVAAAVAAWVGGFALLLSRLGRFNKAKWLFGADVVGGVMLTGAAGWLVLRLATGRL
jgi:putative LysE/RhtB family amino acid efflux pump